MKLTCISQAHEAPAFGVAMTKATPPPILNKIAAALIESALANFSVSGLHRATPKCQKYIQF
ncbi:hypothetical protein PQQ86_35350 [Paraburkholderia sediminicola]|uniref:hypothetical protein n=1 Tax=Paraburkholderia sediminicola TaxID=458836 RepID=UPI0038BB2207